MFNSKKSTRGVSAPITTTSGPELRRRHGTGPPNSEPSKYYAASPYLDKEPSSASESTENTKQLHQHKVKQSKSRQEAAVQIEKTVAEVTD
jgi:hypothetical protein